VNKFERYKTSIKEKMTLSNFRYSISNIAAMLGEIELERIRRLSWWKQI
jgi:hypothetical protein